MDAPKVQTARQLRDLLNEYINAIYRYEEDGYGDDTDIAFDEALEAVCEFVRKLDI